MHYDEQISIGSATANMHQTDVAAGGLALRLDFTLADYLSVGTELGFAVLDVGGPERREGDLVHQVRSGWALRGGLVLGVALPIEDVTLRAEALVGGRGTFIERETRVRDCVGTTSSVAAELVVEPRVALDWFVLPRISLGAYIGTNVIVPGELSGGVTLAFHLRPYDGQARR